MKLDILLRIACTVIASSIYHYINIFLDSYSGSMQANAALAQFKMNSTEYAVSHARMSFWQDFHVPFIVFMIVLAVIWWKYIKMIKDLPLLIVGTLCASLMLVPQKSFAYYDTKDYAESYPVLPNQTAFLVSNDGDPTKQAEMQSEEYLMQNKVATELVQIPHQKLRGSGIFQDSYIPAARLIFVDRTTYSRTWVSSATRGTNNQDEGQQCQSKDGLNITAGVSISTRIDPQYAARYLYNFGVIANKPDFNNPQELFISYYHAKDLSYVMDTTVKGVIHTLVCNEINKRTLDEANADMTAEMVSIQKATEEYLKSVGITLINVGWADTFSFDPAVQKAINDRYVAQTVSPYIKELQALADIKVKEGMAFGLQEHGVPQTLYMPRDDAMNMFAPMLKAGTAPSTAK